MFWDTSSVPAINLAEYSCIFSFAFNLRGGWSSKNLPNYLKTCLQRVQCMILSHMSACLAVLFYQRFVGNQISEAYGYDFVVSHYKIHNTSEHFNTGEQLHPR